MGKEKDSLQNTGSPKKCLHTVSVDSNYIFKIKCMLINTAFTPFKVCSEKKSSTKRKRKQKILAT